jgi:hypothetical protein
LTPEIELLAQGFVEEGFELRLVADIRPVAVSRRRRTTGITGRVCLASILFSTHSMLGSMKVQEPMFFGSS